MCDWFSLWIRNPISTHRWWCKWMVYEDLSVYLLYVYLYLYRPLWANLKWHIKVRIAPASGQSFSSFYFYVLLMSRNVNIIHLFYIDHTILHIRNSVFGCISQYRFSSFFFPDLFDNGSIIVERREHLPHKIPQNQKRYDDWCFYDQGRHVKKKIFLNTDPCQPTFEKWEEKERRNLIWNHISQ